MVFKKGERVRIKNQVLPASTKIEIANNQRDNIKFVAIRISTPFTHQVKIVKADTLERV